MLPGLAARSPRESTFKLAGLPFLTLACRRPHVLPAVHVRDPCRQVPHLPPRTWRGPAHCRLSPRRQLLRPPPSNPRPDLPLRLPPSSTGCRPACHLRIPHRQVPPNMPPRQLPLPPGSASGSSSKAVAVAARVRHIWWPWVNSWPCPSAATCCMGARSVPAPCGAGWGGTKQGDSAHPSATICCMGAGSVPAPCARRVGGN